MTKYDKIEDVSDDSKYSDANKDYTTNPKELFLMSVFVSSI